ncbi:uncharacterized protein TRIVIDRAFT_185676 [Trichoderma virens Gv29-8]|uniref:Uncharacterized protein n=1 Tax=Hypocrea virens (strain Gv29-8 / FGSC 10586) TaxID=413071 RepID=G9MG74_HYPVG|nr:uncharacterized protein TRIVIDRAFT_185676 [Trichoderma virens Gv29-8]EHK26524.1 hypothetical protein TRIVIDRAFT_185676 [Trichoderma virens Gv29-8]
MLSTYCPGTGISTVTLSTRQSGKLKIPGSIVGEESVHSQFDSHAAAPPKRSIPALPVDLALFPRGVHLSLFENKMRADG